jgi:phosphoglycolate phosphatase
MTRPPHCLLLDLDGTLVDTAPDFVHTLNLLRAEHGLGPLAADIVRPHVSHGVRMLIRLGFGLLEGDERFEGLRQRFLELYRVHLVRESRPFPGMASVLAAIEARGMRWGVVTNKPAAFTHPLLAGLELEKRAACIVSGDTTAHAKPHPAPLLHAAKLLALAPRDCLYVGDDRRDIDAGRGAGMRTLVAMFGYIAAAENPREWQADGLVHRPEEILAWFPAGAEAAP